MATSESDDFESADEELNQDIPAKRIGQRQQWSSPVTIGSESDDDTEFVPRTQCTNINYNEKSERHFSARTAARAGGRTSAKDTSRKDDNDASIVNTSEDKLPEKPAQDVKKECKDTKQKDATCKIQEAEGSDIKADNVSQKSAEEMGAEVKASEEKKAELKTAQVLTDKAITLQESSIKSSGKPQVRGKSHTQRRPEGSHQSGAKKLGTRIIQNTNVKPAADVAAETAIKNADIPEKMEELSIEDSLKGNLDLSGFPSNIDQPGISIKEELTESDMPDELKSDKKFKEVFRPEGWEKLGKEIELPEELTEEKLQPVLEKLSSVGQEFEGPNSWGGWGNWGVSSLINSATAGVSTLSSHVSHGFTLLEGSMGVPDPSELAKTEHEEPVNDDKNLEVAEESQLQIPFGFGNLMSSVSSITKLVESTGTKVMTGGLDALETIGKKTMEVLQEGDPGLKKKRAFFMNETDKPILSQVLREAKEKAETTEKTVEEKERARKVHFESLFDDYQGLVHLEALEMLSRQSDIKIQQCLACLDTNELTSVQETLEEVKELCDLGDEDDNDEGQSDKDLKLRMKETCHDLGVNISYDKLYTIWEESQSYLVPAIEHTDYEIFESAISAMAQFTAFSVERFHKTAELLLIKEHRSTVNEADALVQLTRILSNQVGTIANHYCTALNERVKTSEKPETSGNITMVFMEAANASSYIQDAFRLLIPIIQVGAI